MDTSHNEKRRNYVCFLKIISPRYTSTFSAEVIISVYLNCADFYYSAHIQSLIRFTPPHKNVLCLHVSASNIRPMHTVQQPRVVATDERDAALDQIEQEVHVGEQQKHQQRQQQQQQQQQRPQQRQRVSAIVAGVAPLGDAAAAWAQATAPPMAVMQTADAVATAPPIGLVYDAATPVSPRVDFRLSERERLLRYNNTLLKSEGNALLLRY